MKTLPTIPTPAHPDPVAHLLGASPHAMSTEELRSHIEKTRELIGSPLSLRKELTRAKPSDDSEARAIANLEL